MSPASFVRFICTPLSVHDFLARTYWTLPTVDTSEHTEISFTLTRLNVNAIFISCYHARPTHQGLLLESIQGTCRLSLKMGRGDEQKPLMHSGGNQYWFQIFRNTTSPMQTMLSSNRYWTFADHIPWIDSNNAFSSLQHLFIKDIHRAVPAWWSIRRPSLWGS